MMHASIKDYFESKNHIIAYYKLYVNVPSGPNTYVQSEEYVEIWYFGTGNLINPDCAMKYSYETELTYYMAGHSFSENEMLSALKLKAFF